ncbi:regulatory protein, FmdB family [Salinisphaera sp. C84B14]|uniref:FmdB family zinc ribbon protein n=1 Tax=Salinisphaera sp. C84B14 TaxID=1304155 RepID=UPI0033404AD4
MPIYEYVCRNCGHELERLQRLSEDPLTQCPACDTPELKRKISAAGFRLAGGGWYETDFKSDGKRNIASGDDKSAKSSGSTSSSTSDSAKSDTSTPSSTPAASDKKSDSAASKPTNKTSTPSSSNAGS